MSNPKRLGDLLLEKGFAHCARTFFGPVFLRDQKQDMLRSALIDGMRASYVEDMSCLLELSAPFDVIIPSSHVICQCLPSGIQVDQAGLNSPKEKVSSFSFSGK